MHMFMLMTAAIVLSVLYVLAWRTEPARDRSPVVMRGKSVLISESIKH